MSPGFPYFSKRLTITTIFLKMVSTTLFPYFKKYMHGENFTYGMKSCEADYIFSLGRRNRVKKRKIY